MTVSPRLAKGAIIGADPMNPLTSIVIFQYNPETLRRTLSPRLGAEGGSRAETLRIDGPPTETIDVQIVIDAADRLERGESLGGRGGILPELSAIEMLMYPKSAVVIANTALRFAGTIEVVPPDVPLTLFVWGTQRITPVVVTSYSATEELHDPALNPLRARVELGLRVLTYDDLPVTHPGYWAFMSHQLVKEALAVLASVETVASVGSSEPSDVAATRI